MTAQEFNEWWLSLDEDGRRIALQEAAEVVFNDPEVRDDTPTRVIRDMVKTRALVRIRAVRGERVVADG